MALDANGKLIEESTSSGRPYVGIDKDVNARRSVVAGRKGHHHIQTTATTTATNSIFDVETIMYIINDGINDLLINFDGTDPGSGANTTIVLKPGEGISDFPRKCSTLHYKTQYGETQFRALGVK